jgi:hypothetical protein
MMHWLGLLSLFAVYGLAVLMLLRMGKETK